MEEETTLERQTNLPIAKEAEPSSPNPPILVHAELLSQGATDEENYHWASPELGNFLTHSSHLFHWAQKPGQEEQFPTRWHKVGKFPCYMYLDAPQTKYVRASQAIPARK